MKPRMSLRTLLWLTTIAAILAGWWTDHARVARLTDEFESLRRDYQLLSGEAESLRFGAATEEISAFKILERFDEYRGRTSISRDLTDPAA